MTKRKRRPTEGSADSQEKMLAQPVASTQPPDTPSTKRPRTPTKYQERVYAVCRKIPKGKVGTYGLLAKVLDSSARAVGQALRNNPYAPEVPCHRVVAGNLDIGGFGGQWGTDCEKVKRKREMLQEEGVEFEEFCVKQGFVVDPSELVGEDKGGD